MPSVAKSTLRNLLNEIEKFSIYMEKKHKLDKEFIKNTSKKRKVKKFKVAFDKVLKKGKIPVISEIKKKSPSQGKINKSFIINLIINLLLFFYTFQPIID